MCLCVSIEWRVFECLSKQECVSTVCVNSKQECVSTVCLSLQSSAYVFADNHVLVFFFVWWVLVGGFQQTSVYLYVSTIECVCVCVFGVAADFRVNFRFYSSPHLLDMRLMSDSHGMSSRSVRIVFLHSILLLRSFLNSVWIDFLFFMDLKTYYDIQDSYNFLVFFLPLCELLFLTAYISLSEWF